MFKRLSQRKLCLGNSTQKASFRKTVLTPTSSLSIYSAVCKHKQRFLKRTRIIAALQAALLIKPASKETHKQ